MAGLTVDLAPYPGATGVTLRSALFDSPSLGAARQMALDETMLERAATGGAGLRFFRWASRAVTFGYSQKWEEAKAAGEARGLIGVPVVRRPTGGGVVFHDGDVTFSWVFEWPSGVAPTAIYKDIHRAVHLGLKSIGVPTRLWSPPASERGKEAAVACFPCPVAIDVVDDDGRKILGGALRKRRGFGLYQGSLRPEGLGRAPEALERAIAAGLFEGSLPPLQLMDAMLDEAKQLALERYATDDWNKKR